MSETKSVTGAFPEGRPFNKNNILQSNPQGMRHHHHPNQTPQITPHYQIPHSTSSPHIIPRLRHTPPLRPLRLLTNALSLRIRQARLEVLRCRVLAVIIREHAQRVDLVQTAAEVDLHGVVLEVHFDALVEGDVDLVAGVAEAAVGVVEGVDVGVFGEGGGGEEGDEDGWGVVHCGEEVWN